MTSYSSVRRMLKSYGLLFMLAIAPPVLGNDAALSLAESRPTPCLNAVAPLLVSEVIQHGAHSFLQGIGRGKKFNSAWAPGNTFYDQAYSSVYSAISEDEAIRGQFSVLSAKLYLTIKFRRATPEEQVYLRTFLSSPEGIIYWDYMLDGALCQGMFEGLAKRGVQLSHDQKAIADSWSKQFPVMHKGFETAFPQLLPPQKADFDKGYKLMSRLSKSTAPDERQFQESLIPDDKFKAAAERSLQAVVRKIDPLVKDFAQSQH